MTIKFTKTIEITGDVWFRIYANDSCIKSFMERDVEADYLNWRGIDNRIPEYKEAKEVLKKYKL